VHVGDGVDPVRILDPNGLRDVPGRVVDDVRRAEAARVVGVIARAHRHDSIPSSRRELDEVAADPTGRADRDHGLSFAEGEGIGHVQGRYAGGGEGRRGCMLDGRRLPRDRAG